MALRKLDNLKGIKVHWTEGSQYDKATHNGIVVGVEVKVKVFNNDTEKVEMLDPDELDKGWSKDGLE